MKQSATNGASAPPQKKKSAKPNPDEPIGFRPTSPAEPEKDEKDRAWLRWNDALHVANIATKLDSIENHVALASRDVTRVRGYLQAFSAKLENPIVRHDADRALDSLLSALIAFSDVRDHLALLASNAADEIGIEDEDEYPHPLVRLTFAIERHRKVFVAEREAGKTA